MNKNQKLLESFVAYCKMYPELRFWQALRGWAGVNFIYASSGLLDEVVHHWKECECGRHNYANIVAIDTFYWEGKDS